ncbi:hypothetical protein D3C76_1254150 [compost metagenome]
MQRRAIGHGRGQLQGKGAIRLHRPGPHDLALVVRYGYRCSCFTAPRDCTAIGADDQATGGRWRSGVTTARIDVRRGDGAGSGGVAGGIGGRYL